MRKKILLCLVLAIAVLSVSCVSSYTSDAPEELMTYAYVVEAPNKSAAALFVDANSWFVDMFKSADSVIQYSDKEAGMVKGKYTHEVMDGIYYVMITSTITVEVKDERCRISFDSPYYKITGDALNGRYGGGASGPVESTKMLTEKVRPMWETLSKGFETAVFAGRQEW